jgi:hypothetical protein
MSAVETFRGPDQRQMRRFLPDMELAAG